MSTKPPNQTFPDGLVDCILSQLSLSLRNHIIFNWAHQFAKGTKQDLSIAEIISTITTLDFSSYRSINPDTFTTLANLPLSNLKHLNLSSIPFKKRNCSQILGAISSSPVFDNLESLDLSNSEQKTLDNVLSGPNSFPNLTTLSLSANFGISISSLVNTDKLPSLRHLDLSGCWLENNDVKIMTESNVVFKLESFNLFDNFSIDRCDDEDGYDPFMALFKAPFMANIRDLNLDGTGCDSATVSFLLDDKAGPFSRKLVVDPPHHHQSQQPSQQDCSDNHALTTSGSNQLTRLCLGHVNQKALCDLASSPLVSDLTHLSLYLNDADSIDLGVLRKSKYLSNLKELSIPFSDDFNPISLADLLCPPDNDTDYPSFRLEKLEVNQARLSRQDVLALCTSPCLSTLKSLSLIGCKLQSDVDDNSDNDSISKPPFDWGHALELLSQSTIISNLTHLDLASTSNSPSFLSSLKSLLRSDLLSSDLVELDFCRNRLDAECIEIITSRRVIEGDESSPLKFGKLQKLTLSHCGLRDGSLSSISQLTELQHLDISFYWGDDGDALINSLISPQETLPFLPKLSNLTHLHLPHSKITDSAVTALSQSQLLNGLVELNLSHNYLGYRGLQTLFTTKLVSKLKVLDLRFNFNNFRNDGPPLKIKDLSYLGDCEVNHQYLG